MFETWTNKISYWASDYTGEQEQQPTPTVKTLGYATIYRPDLATHMKILAVVFDNLTPTIVNQEEINSYRGNYAVQCPVGGFSIPDGVKFSTWNKKEINHV